MRTHTLPALRSKVLRGGGTWTYRAAIVALLSINVNPMLGQLNLSLVPSEHNGYQVSCFGFKDGSVDLTVTGGTPPYTFAWTNGATTEDVANLPAGFYGVTVADANQMNGRGEITLTEPASLRADVLPFEYGNGYNISLFNAYNGSINLTVDGGVPPFNFAWSDGPTTEDRTALGSDNYSVTITDANGCILRTDPVYLRQPDRSDWTMNGNAGTIPGTHFFGTTDNQDVVFKSNGQERLRLEDDGSLKATSLAFDHGYRLVMVDSTGRLKLLTDNNGNDAPLATTCYDHGSNLPWTFCGNIVFPTAKLGTRNNVPLRLISNNVERMTLYTNGKVGIGTVPPGGPIDQYRLFVEDGIVTRDVLAKVGPWPDYVFKEGYHLLSFDEWRNFIRDNGHLPGLLSAAEVEKKGGIELADSHTRLVKVVEEQALYILRLEERIKQLEMSIH